MATKSSSSPSIVPALVGNFVFLGPLLWIQELLQNILTRAVTGDWGWIYPRSDHVWWSFHTMPSWGTVAVVWYALNTQVLIPAIRRGDLGIIATSPSSNITCRLIIMAAIGWVVEYLNGFVQEHSGSEGLQVWPGSPLRYVTYGCYLWWIQNGLTWFALNAGLVAAGKAIALSDLSACTSNITAKKRKLG